MCPSSFAALTPLAAGYRTWIAQQEARITEPDSHLAGYAQDAADALAAARRAADRIEAGIGVLQDNESALAAFRFANQAMYLQRVHTLAAEIRTRDETLSLDDALARVDEPRNHSWRPFQLAFILLNLPALADPTHRERADGGTALADLLWFPTGGGKTEAYLGLTAFVLAIRRLQEGLWRVRHPGRSGRRDALHAAAAHHPAVPARRCAGLRMRDDPPR